MATKILTGLLLTLRPWALLADYGCLSEEQPICILYHDAANTYRQKFDQQCLKAAGKPVNTCPAKAVFSCKLRPGEGGVETTRYGYRAALKKKFLAACAAEGGKSAEITE